MNIGNISQTVWKRFIQRQLSSAEKNQFFPLSCTGEWIKMEIEEGCQAVSASGKASGESDNVGVYAAAYAANNLLCHRARPLGISLEITMPPATSEIQLGDIVCQVKKFCDEINVPLAEVKADVDPAVLLTFIRAQAFGKVRKEDWVSAKKAEAGEDIVLLGYVGLEGSLRILDEKEEELGKRFAPSFIRKIRGMRSCLSMPQVWEAIKDVDITAVRQIGSGGIFASLWDLADGSMNGFNVELPKMTLCQETVEICEYYHLNPYIMTSAGSFLIVTKNGKELVKAFRGAGARAAVIGASAQGKAKIITEKEGERFLGRPAPDELALWRQRELPGENK